MSRTELRVDQPQPNDLVFDPLLVAGSGGGFEATLVVRVLDAEGNELLTAPVTARNLISPWQTQLELPEPPPTDRGVVEVLSSTGADESPPAVSVPVFFGTAIVPGSTSYLLHVVQAGETLSSIAANEPLYAGSGFRPIFRANQDILGDPDLIHPGQVLRIPVDF